MGGPNHATSVGRSARRSIFWLLVLVLLSFAIGFVVLPSVQKDFTAQGVWAAICRAAGVPAERTTRVVRDPAMFRRESPGTIGLGGSIALQQCTMCHGAQGVTAADTPNLAGQFPEVIVKQLIDYKNGHRTHSLMQALSANLADDDMHNLAAYYASLPKLRLETTADDSPPPALVRVGDPVRNI